MPHEVDLDELQNGVPSEQYQEQQPQYVPAALVGDDNVSARASGLRIKAASAVGKSGRSFGVFFGRALEIAGKWAAPLAVFPGAGAFYLWKLHGEPGLRQFLPGILVGVLVVVLVFSLWLWAYRHNSKGKTSATVTAYVLLGLSVIVVVGVCVYNPRLGVGVLIDFVVTSLIVELAAAKQGEREYDRGRQDERAALVDLAFAIGDNLSVVAQHAASMEQSASKAKKSAELVAQSSQEAGNAAARIEAAMGRAEHIRNNLEEVVTHRADEMVPQLVAQKQGEAEAAHQRALVEARQAGKHEADGEITEMRRQLTAAVGLLQQNGIVDEHGRVIG